MTSHHRPTRPGHIIDQAVGADEAIRSATSRQAVHVAKVRKRNARVMLALIGAPIFGVFMALASSTAEHYFHSHFLVSFAVGVLFGWIGFDAWMPKGGDE